MKRQGNTPPERLCPAASEKNRNADQDSSSGPAGRFADFNNRALEGGRRPPVPGRDVNGRDAQSEVKTPIQLWEEKQAKLREEYNSVKDALPRVVSFPPPGTLFPELKRVMTCSLCHNMPVPEKGMTTTCALGHYICSSCTNEVPACPKPKLSHLATDNSTSCSAEIKPPTPSPWYIFFYNQVHGPASHAAAPDH